MSKQCQNSAKYRPTATYTVPRLQYSTELHQKDLRINPYLGHIWDPEIKVFLEADTFLALSLIVRVYASDGSYTARRIDIQYPRPCQLLETCPYLRFSHFYMNYGHLTELWTFD